MVGGDLGGWGLHSHFHVQPNYSDEVVLRCRWGCDKKSTEQQEPKRTKREGGAKKTKIQKITGGVPQIQTNNDNRIVTNIKTIENKPVRGHTRRRMGNHSST